MIFSENKQQSEGWKTDRIGLPSASKFDSLVTTKGVESKQARKYMYRLAGETIAHKKKAEFSNYHMKRGIEFEPMARQFYEITRSVVVEEVGLCWQDERKLWGASCDGLVGDDGLIEIKCCDMEIVVECLLSDKPPAVYSFQQVQGQMMVTGRKWCDLFVYYEGLPAYCMRVDRDEVFIVALKMELESFCKKLDETVEILRQK